jgi:hypothetical protein
MTDTNVKIKIISKDEYKYRGVLIIGFVYESERKISV